MDLDNGVVHGVAVRGTGGNRFVPTEPGCRASRICDDLSAKYIGNHVLRLDAFAHYGLPDLDVLDTYSLIDDERDIPGLEDTFSVQDERLVVDATVHLKIELRTAKRCKCGSKKEMPRCY